MNTHHKDQLKDPDYMPPLHQAIPLGIQHILAMFISNITPAIIISLAAGFSFGSADMVYMIQMVMVFAGVATLLQTIGLGPVGARLPIVQGTSFAFLPIIKTNSPSKCTFVESSGKIIISPSPINEEGDLKNNGGGRLDSDER